MHENSLLVLTVPAYSYLFGPHDVRMGHFRRYSKSDLERKFLNKGYGILFSIYYCFFAFPAFLVIRLIEKFLYKSGKEYRMKIPLKIVNSILAYVFSLEKNFLLKNLNLPFGYSIVLFAGIAER